MLAAYEHEEPPEIELSPEKRRRRYKDLGVRFTVDREGNLEGKWYVESATHMRTLWPPAAVTSRARFA